jgi:type II restriction enzyme
VTGAALPVAERVGFLDRKLRVVTEKTRTRGEWSKQALAALGASYGFEYQGDNLLIARINVFLRNEPRVFVG